jgi:hypothetical protein
MTSSQEAFQRFFEWKLSKTPLRLTVIEKGKLPHELIVQIIAVDDQVFQVSFLTIQELVPRVIDFTDSTFRIGKRVLEAERPTGDYLALSVQLEAPASN